MLKVSILSSSLLHIISNFNQTFYAPLIFWLKCRALIGLGRKALPTITTSTKMSSGDLTLLYLLVVGRCCTCTPEGNVSTNDGLVSFFTQVQVGKQDYCLHSMKQGTRISCILNYFHLCPCLLFICILRLNFNRDKPSVSALSLTL